MDLSPSPKAGLPLAPDERVLRSCPVEGGTLYATDRRLLYQSDSRHHDGARDLLYSEISSLELERRRERDLLGWGVTFMVAGIIAFLLFFATAILVGWALGLVVLLAGALLAAFHLLDRRLYLVCAGSGLLADRRVARRWRFAVMDLEAATALMQAARGKLQ